MLKTKIIHKLLMTTFAFFIIIVVISLTSYDGIVLNKVSYKKDLVSIFLLDKRDYLTEVMILVDDKTDPVVVFEIIDNLKNSNKYYRELRGIIPNNTKVNKVKLEDNIMYIDFNEDLLKVNSSLEEKVIESLIYSITSLKSVDGLKLTINGKDLKVLPQSNILLDSILTKNFGINKEYNINKTTDITKVILYYYQTIDDNDYYVPVTRYINNNEDKVKVIIDNLKNSYLTETNLMSYLNNRIEIIRYQQENDIVTLSFDNLITLNPNSAINEVIYTISNSIFDSTDIQKVIFTENDKIIKVSLR